ncbi:hypothetical protein F5B20DRAFT_550812 [Whalleya microplaca]|nr:hypothetical protein F5B20DRAFT_550812 [Whalleya microplaca]
MTRVGRVFPISKTISLAVMALIPRAFIRLWSWTVVGSSERGDRSRPTKMVTYREEWHYVHTPVKNAYITHTYTHAYNTLTYTMEYDWKTTGMACVGEATVEKQEHFQMPNKQQIEMRLV